MRVEKATVLGFCGGVRNAVAKVFKLAEEHPDEKISVYGQLAHNKAVMDKVRALGVRIVNSPDEVEKGERVVLRAHGVPDRDRESFKINGAVIEDATCPNVLRNQKAARNAERPVLILGYAGHSEVNAIVGAARGEYQIVSSISDIENVDTSKEYDIIVQTTFDSRLYEEIVGKLEEKGVSFDVKTRICLASGLRRRAIHELLNRDIECIVVIGDNASANSKALFEEAKSTGLPSFFVSGADDVGSDLRRFHSVGVSAGSSTPDDVIDEVVRRLESL